MADRAGAAAKACCFLTDEQLRQGIEAMFFAYRGFTADPDRILADMAYGRAASPGDPFHQSRARHHGEQSAQPFWA